MSDLSAGAGFNTYVSAPQGQPVSAVPGDSANGASLPGANMSITSAVLIPFGTAAAGLVGLYWLFRRQGAGLPPLRVDSAQVINVYLSWMVINVPLKLVAYKYHGHKSAQAFLLIA